MHITTAAAPTHGRPHARGPGEAGQEDGEAQERDQRAPERRGEKDGGWAEHHAGQQVEGPVFAPLLAVPLWVAGVSGLGEGGVQARMNTG
jgi:hypothetical protein